MDASNKSNSDLTRLFKFWIPWQSEPVHLSRDFWMPDHSCRVCYECDSQFTFFNRRHHCRICGRIFCAKCTSNWLPTWSSETEASKEDWDMIRVCDYCYKQWKKELIEPVENGAEVANLDIVSSSPSTNSFISVKSGETSDSSSCTFLSLSQSSGHSPYQSEVMETCTDTQSVTGAMSNDDALNVGEQNWSQNQFGPFQRRTQSEDDFGDAHCSSSACPLSQVNGYFGHVQFDNMDNEYKSCKVHLDGDTIDSRYTNNSSLENNFDSQTPKEDQKIVQKDFERDIIDEWEAPSSIYVAEDVNAEPVDFVNNGVLWLPPEPEDEEDEREALFVDDDDDENATGEWGYFRNSSFGNGGNRSRDKSNEEHKRAVKNVLDSHFRALVAQLLQVEDVLVGDDNDKESWLEIIISLSWEAATLLKPDMSYGGQMDPGGYVQVKCISSGRRSESMVVKGVVCKKNVAHRRMTSKIEKARLLILGGALEYQRVPSALSSIDTLLQQEMDHLKMAVAKIDAHNPDVLLVEKSVSRYAQEYLLEKDISLVLNIKRPLLERIARCTGGQIVLSIDQLSSPKLGYCDMFHVEKFPEQHCTASQNGKKLMKTLMYFEGCSKPLGCTILLRGANEDELKKVKHVIQYGVFAAYHLALETSFLADEGAALPILPSNTPITVALPDKPSSIDRSISTIPDFTIPINEMASGTEPIGERQRSNSVPISELVKETIASISKNAYDQASKLPVCGNSQYTSVLSDNREDFQPSLLNEPSLHRASEDHHTDFLTSSEDKVSEADTLASTKASYISNEFVDSNIMQSDSFDIGSNRSVSNSTSMQHDRKQTLKEQPTFKDEFSATPADNQSILVSLSSRCVWKGTVCERSHLFRIKYYGSFDKPLGRYLRDQLFDQNYRCPSCDLPAEAHVQCYTHHQGTLTISVKKLQDILLPGEKDGKIWMWHRCLKCPRANGFPPATWRVVMSDAAWGLSLGKFLELSFSNHAAANRVASCGHSLHRDCLRFYGFGKMVACFRYASIDVHSVYLPPSMLGFNYENQEWIEKELNGVVARAELLFSEVLNALRLLVERKSGSNQLSKAPESRSNITNLDALLQKEKSDFEESLQKILNKEVDQGHRVCDILELNRLRRQLMLNSYVWDQRLINADSIKIKCQPDDIAVTLSETIQKPPAVTEKPFDTTIPAKLGETSGSSCNTTEDVKQDQSLECDAGHSNHLKVRDQKTDSGHLSNTMDAVSTDGNYLSEEISKRSNVFESLEADKASAGETKKLEVEEGNEDASISILSRTPSFVSSSDSMEDPATWLGMSFMSLYKSLNKNILGSAQKLDKFRQYNPIYISFPDSGLQCGARFLLPVGVNDTVVPVFYDEPTSIISFALLSPDYFAQMSDKPGRPIDTANDMLSLQFLDFGSWDEKMLEFYRSSGSVDKGMVSSTTTHSSLRPPSVLNNGHTRVTFTDDGPLGKVKYKVTCYYAKDFESLRALCCPSELDFIRSLSRCKKWGAQGGKSNVFFAKTWDDRFIIKQVTRTELESFIKFGPRYFNYLTESINTGSTTCLAKILGIYQVTSKHLKGGKETKMDMLVMENLLYRRNLTRLYDLKGSSRSRYNPDSSGSNKVLLDQNLIEAMPTAPIFVGNKAKRLLERAVWNDTAFLASIGVMDYSLLVGVDEEKHELVLGIIDFMRQYTWDKQLESRVKESGILGGPKYASPTVIPPKQYKTRFRKAMTTYFLMVPDQWSPAMIIPSKSQVDLREKNITKHTTSAE